MLQRKNKENEYCFFFVIDGCKRVEARERFFIFHLSQEKVTNIIQLIQASWSLFCKWKIYKNLIYVGVNWFT